MEWNTRTEVLMRGQIKYPIFSEFYTTTVSINEVDMFRMRLANTKQFQLFKRSFVGLNFYAAQIAIIWSYFPSVSSWWKFSQINWIIFIPFFFIFVQVFWIMKLFSNNTIYLFGSLWKRELIIATNNGIYNGRRSQTLTCTIHLRQSISCIYLTQWKKRINSLFLIFSCSFHSKTSKIWCKQKICANQITSSNIR